MPIELDEGKNPARGVLILGNYVALMSTFMEIAFRYFFLFFSRKVKE